ncbi:hypothetical protein KQI84_10140 [bacterium]|nr:hypothetical protein [bacterium]
MSLARQLLAIERRRLLRRLLPIAAGATILAFLGLFFAVSIGNHGPSGILEDFRSPRREFDFFVERLIKNGLILLIPLFAGLAGHLIHVPLAATRIWTQPRTQSLLADLRHAPLRWSHVVLAVLAARLLPLILLYSALPVGIALLLLARSEMISSLLFLFYFPLEMAAAGVLLGALALRWKHMPPMVLVAAAAPVLLAVHPFFLGMISAAFMFGSLGRSVVFWLDEPLGLSLMTAAKLALAAGALWWAVRREGDEV